MEQFFHILTLPDNIPIAGMLLLVLFYYWLGMSQAVKNDKLGEVAETIQGKLKKIIKSL